MRQPASADLSSHCTGPRTSPRLAASRSESAESDGNQRSELLVVDHPEKQLDAARRINLRLDEHRRAESRVHRAPCVPQLVLVPDSSCTPPTSDLCSTPRSLVFRTTGRPISPATSTTASSSRANRHGTADNPPALSTDRLSASVSTRRDRTNCRASSGTDWTPA